MKRRARLRTSTPLKRGRLRSVRRSRDWSVAREKVERQGCRLRWVQGHVCQGPVQAAHVIGRRYDDDVVAADAVIGLCENAHRAYDAHILDLAPYLTEAEWRHAIALVGQGQAERRVMGAAWRDVA